MFEMQERPITPEPVDHRDAEVERVINARMECERVYSKVNQEFRKAAYKWESVQKHPARPAEWIQARDQHDYWQQKEADARAGLDRAVRKEEIARDPDPVARRKRELLFVKDLQSKIVNTAKDAMDRIDADYQRMVTERRMHANAFNSALRQLADIETALGDLTRRPQSAA